MRITNNQFTNDSGNSVFKLNKGTFDIKGRHIIFTLEKITIKGKEYDCLDDGIYQGPFHINFNRPILLVDRNIDVIIFKKDLTLGDNGYWMDYIYEDTDFIPFLKKLGITNEIDIEVAFGEIKGSFIQWLRREAKNSKGN